MGIGIQARGRSGAAQAGQLSRLLRAERSCVGGGTLIPYLPVAVLYNW